jgi:hypothetical protein
MRKFWLILSLLSVSAVSQAYESEDKLQGLLIGKMAQFINWNNDTSDQFVIAVLDESFANLLQSLYANTKIKNKQVTIKHINQIEQLTHGDVLYISNINPAELEKILTLAKQQNILTVSNMRGFAERHGMVQIYFVSQKPRLRINLDSTRQANLQVQSTLLQISDVIREK